MIAWCLGLFAVFPDSEASPSLDPGAPSGDEARAGAVAERASDGTTPIPTVDDPPATNRSTSPIDAPPRPVTPPQSEVPDPSDSDEAMPTGREPARERTRGTPRGREGEGHDGSSSAAEDEREGDGDEHDEAADDGRGRRRRTERERREDTLEWTREIVEFSLRAAVHHVEYADEIADGALDDPDDPAMAAVASTLFEHEYWKPGALPSSSDRFPAGSLYAQLGAYDLSTIRPVFSARRFLPEFEPEGKRVCEIHYATRDIFVPEEPFPTWLNAIHATTKVSTVAAAFQLAVGESYSENRLREVAEDLRNASYYSTVVVVPVVSDEEGCVDIAVITRDLWSLKAGWDLDYSGGVLRELTVQLMETNLAGLNDTLGLVFSLDQGSWELGPLWYADWLGGKNFQAALELRGISDRERGEFDGTAGAFSFGRPIRTTSDRHGWIISGEHRVATERIYDGDALRTDLVRDPETGDIFAIERRWYESNIRSEALRSWAFGVDNRHILSAGGFLQMIDVEPRPYDDRLSDAVLDEFTERYLPRQERGLGPLLRYRFFQRRFVELTNYRDFERTERYRRGFDAWADLRYSEPFVGASDRFLSILATLAYREGFASDGFIELAALQGVRLNTPVSDVRTEGVMRLALPSGVAGRFVDRVFVRRWARNEKNEFYQLSPTNAVRGLDGDIREGSHAFVQNLEWRSRAVNILSVRVGVAFFNDVGATWYAGEAPDWVSSVGFGLRLFAPQFMSTVASLDIGFQVGTGERWTLGSWDVPVAPPSISIRFGQLFKGATAPQSESLEF